VGGCRTCCKGIIVTLKKGFRLMSETTNAEAQRTERKTLLEWRWEFGLTQRELAELSDSTYATIANIERGRCTTKTPTAFRVAKALGLHPHQILAGASRPPRPPTPVVSPTDDGYRPDTPRKPLRWWREKRALSQEHLATLADVSTNTLWNIETGRTSMTKPSVKKRLADALKVAPDKIIFPGEGELTTEET
jgi:transcriptional regulator with XRE-family HTH domain